MVNIAHVYRSTIHLLCYLVQGHNKQDKAKSEYNSLQ